MSYSKNRRVASYHGVLDTERVEKPPHAIVGYVRTLGDNCVDVELEMFARMSVLSSETRELVKAELLNLPKVEPEHPDTKAELESLKAMQGKEVAP